MVTRHPFVVYALGQPEASIVGIRTLDLGVTPGVWYEVYPEKQPAYCHPGAGNLVVAYGTLNVGTVDGTLYGRILGPAGEVVHSGSQWCHAGSFVFWEPILNMPPYDYALTVEVSATPAFSVSEKISFKLMSTEAPPEEEPYPLPLIGAAVLAIVDLGLIGYYIATQLTSKT